MQSRTAWVASNVECGSATTPSLLLFFLAFEEKGGLTISDEDGQPPSQKEERPRLDSNQRPWD